MKFSEKYSHFKLFDFDEDCGVIKIPVWGKCCICGELTDWVSTKIDKPICSEEHLNLLLPTQKVEQ